MKRTYTPALKKAMDKYKSRFKMLNVRLTPEQMEELERRAAAAGKSKNQYAVDAILK